MSRKPAKPFTSNAADPPPAAAPGPTCSGCKHWRRRDEARGLCVLGPPSVNGGATPFGPLCMYPVTEADYPACSRHEPN